MLALRNCFFLAILVLVSACQSLATPQTLEQRIAYVQGQVGGAYQTVADMTNRGQLEKSKARELIEEIDKADNAVKTARLAVKQGLFKDAESSLKAATDLLIVLEKSLQ